MPPAFYKKDEAARGDGGVLCNAGERFMERVPIPVRASYSRSEEFDRYRALCADPRRVPGHDGGKNGGGDAAHLESMREKIEELQSLLARAAG